MLRIRERIRERIQLREQAQHLQQQPQQNNNNLNDEDGLYLACTQRSNFELRRAQPFERNSAFNDVFGRNRLVDAPPIPLDSDRILQQMQRSVGHQRMKPAFNKVFFLNPHYAYSTSLLHLYYTPDDPKGSAQKYVQMWEQKLKYFGLEKLVKPLIFKELLPQDKACLYSGSMQLFRDDHGRIVLCLLPNLLSNQGDSKHLTRTLWYLLFRAIQEEKGKGVVIVLIGDDKNDVFSQAILSSTSVLNQALPIETLAIHVIDCEPSSRHINLLNSLEETVGRSARLRLRYHQYKRDTPFLEPLQERLRKFGINYIPLNADGSLVMNNPMDPFSKRYFFKRPEETMSSDTIIIPKPCDVLLGRGRPFQEFPGNVTLNDKLDEQRELYRGRNSRKDKTNISREILEKITRNGGRFLKKEGDHWIEVADLVAREKIAHGFRMPRKRVRDEIDDILPNAAAGSPARRAAV